jgi:putative FmdB family regulatory protein
VPIYDFKCQQCGKVAEFLLRSNEDHAVRCPDCGSQSMEKLFSAAYLMKMNAEPHGKTCCGREERCETPPCSGDCGCHRG